MRSLLFLLRRALFLGVSAGIWLYSTSAIHAAERIVLKSRFLSDSISVSELSTLAETGKVSHSLQAYFNQSKQNSQDVRRRLTESVSINPLILDRVLNSPAGELVLDQVSQIVHTRSNQPNRQALRSALVLSATPDGQITLMETIKNYPTQEVQVDIERLEDAYQQFQRLRDTAQALQGILEIWK